jgi:hypothetical protein
MKNIEQERQSLQELLQAIERTDKLELTLVQAEIYGAAQADKLLEEEGEDDG